MKPGIVGASSCATGKCFLEVSLTPHFDADNAAVAPHGLIGQSYDADNYGIIGNTDSYLTRGSETSTEAMCVLKGSPANQCAESASRPRLASCHRMLPMS